MPGVQANKNPFKNQEPEARPENFGFGGKAAGPGRISRVVLSAFDRRVRVIIFHAKFRPMRSKI
jgi:hypothetical protein